MASSIAKQIAEIEAGRRPAVLSMGNLESERDIMDVRDTVRAYRAMMTSAKPGVPYNVCSGTPVRIRTLVELLQSKARVPITIEQDPARFRPNDTPLVLGDHRRLTSDTGWVPQIPLAQTVEDLLVVLAQPDWLDRRTKSEIIGRMATVLPLFDLGRSPTTRDIAQLVKDGGVAALPDARRRGDAATYQEVRCRSALNRCQGHAVHEVDAQPVSRLHARLPLLLRAPLSNTARA